MPDKTNNKVLKIVLFSLIIVFILGNITLAFTYYEDETSDLIGMFLLVSGIKEEFHIPSDWAPINVATCPENAQLAIKLNNLTEVKRCTEEEIPLENGKKVDYINIEYGPGMDCPSGCIFKYISGIIEDGNYYDLAFYKREIEILGVPYPECEPTILPLKHNGMYKWGAIYNKTSGKAFKTGAYWDASELEGVRC